MMDEPGKRTAIAPKALTTTIHGAIVMANAKLGQARALAQRDAYRFGEDKGKSAEDRREAMERLKLAAKNEKLMILVGWIGAALGIVGAGMIWGWGGVLLSFGLWLYTAAIRAERKK
jgi:hypothetical protein